MLSNVNQYGKWYKSQIGAEIVSKKYLHDDEIFIDFANRVSNIFNDSTFANRIYGSIIRGDFFPAGRSLYGAGSKGKFKSTMSNCYISPSPSDNIESIFDTAKEMARIFSMGGGVGVNISNLRPNGAKVSNAAKTSTGACSFMNIFDSVGETIGANNRRAALMIGLNCDHPDIEEFLEVKSNNDKVQSANISILFDDKFMNAVKNNEMYDLYFKVDATGEEIKKQINARDFFLKFAEKNFDYAEPGCLFVDKIRSYNLLSAYPKEEYKIEISNPCAEYFGNKYNSCNLGSINLYNIVERPFTKEAYINYDKLSKLISMGVRALDEILDYGYDMQPLQQNKDCIDDWRAIGLGVFGLADMFVALGIKYGSVKSLQTVQLIMGHVWMEAVSTSVELAKEKGTFKKYNWEYIKQSPLISAELLGDDVYEDIQKYGLRNGSLLAIAPTGSISTMCGCSGGAEPLFAVSYERTTHALSAKKQYFKVYAKSVEHLLLHHNIDVNTITTEEIQKIFPFVVASHDIDPIDRVMMQSHMQKFVDNAISSTINLKHETTVDDIFNIYIAAWENGCKGLTVFRDGCARTAILTTKPQGKDDVSENVTTTNKKVFDSISPVKRVEFGTTCGSTIKQSTACVPSMYVTVNQHDGNIVEVFTNVSQGCSSNIGSITRLASLALRSGVMVEEIVKEMKSNHCQACAVVKSKGQKVSNSCSYAIAEAIEKSYKEKENDYPSKQIDRQEIIVDAVLWNGMIACPECGEKTLRPEGRCFTCTSCLYSKCE